MRHEQTESSHFCSSQLRRNAAVLCQSFNPDVNSRHTDRVVTSSGGNGRNRDFSVFLRQKLHERSAAGGNIWKHVDLQVIFTQQSGLSLALSEFSDCSVNVKQSPEILLLKSCITSTPSCGHYGSVPASFAVKLNRQPK